MTYNIYILKFLRKIYLDAFPTKNISLPDCEQNPELVSKIIYDILVSDKPCMIARFGANELSTVVNYIGVKGRKRDVIRYIKGEVLPWWWNENHIKGNMYNVAGFFPPTINKIESFCQLMINDMAEVDILGSWLKNECYFNNNLNCTKVHIRLLEPFWSTKVWTKALKGKKILVVHPFAETILKQYENRDKLFSIKETLPDFASLTIIKAVQAMDQASNLYDDWFEALDSMKSQIDKADFDICLIGAGAYGFPLAAHVKRIGKKSVHLGGSLQLLFGIIGKRWEDPNYGVNNWKIPYGSYTSLMNDYWVRPVLTEKPLNANKIEDACYW